MMIRRSLSDAKKNTESKCLQRRLNGFLFFNWWQLALRPVTVSDKDTNKTSDENCLAMRSLFPMCGGKTHDRLPCPARDRICFKYGKKNIFPKGADHLQDQEQEDLQLCYRKMNVSMMNLNWFLLSKKRGG